MTVGTGIRAALHEAAAEVTGYDVLDGAVTQGRRRRRHAAVGAALAVLAVLGLVGVVAVSWPPRGAPVTGARDLPTIPERIGPPAPFTRDAAGSPPGRASLIFASYGGEVVVVGAATDTYRTIDTSAQPGWHALLSPAGDQVAYFRDGEVRVVDLVKGGVRSYGPGDSAVDAFAPLAWLPDGSGLVVVATIDPDDPTTQGTTKRLSTLDLATGAPDQFADATWPIATPGFAVAVSPDGSRIAYQFSDFVTVYDRRTREKTRFSPDSPYFALAGRSAWGPDGSLTLLQKTWNSYEPSWNLVLVDLITGTPRETIPVGMDQMAIRLIGWSHGHPVVVGYDGPYSALTCRAASSCRAFRASSAYTCSRTRKPGCWSSPSTGLASSTSRRSCSPNRTAGPAIHRGHSRGDLHWDCCWPPRWRSAP